MLNKRLVLLFGVLLLFIILFCGIIKNISSRILPDRHIALGAWTGGLFDASTQTLHPEKLLEFEKLVNKKFSIAHYYIGWEALANPDLIKQFNNLNANGWEPMLNVNPYYFKECPAEDLPLYRAIAEGKCDDFLKNAGKNLSQIQKPFYLVFAWEMNNKQNAWSISYTGSTTDDFISAWKHIHDIFREENAVNVVWVFCPNVPDDSNTPYNKIYPGDDYVDWTGLDGYNWGTTQSWSQWVDFAGVFSDAYKKITMIAPKKPIMLAEVNTTDKGGDKGTWYKDMFEKQIPYNFPKIQAIVIFNEDKSNVENVNWKVDVNKGSLDSFISAIHTKFY